VHDRRRRIVRIRLPVGAALDQLVVGAGYRAMGCGEHELTRDRGAGAEITWRTIAAASADRMTQPITAAVGRGVRGEWSADVMPWSSTERDVPVAANFP
jgi:hypothetical protein